MLLGDRHAPTRLLGSDTGKESTKHKSSVNNVENPCDCDALLLGLRWRTWLPPSPGADAQIGSMLVRIRQVSDTCVVSIGVHAL